MKTVQDKDGKTIEVVDDTPCYAGLNGALPIMYDEVKDADIFAEMEERVRQSLIDKEEYEATTKYIDDRKKAYGTLEQQIENIIEKGLVFEKARVMEIKVLYPKPE